MNTIQDYINDKVLNICKKEQDFSITEDGGQLICEFENGTEDNLSLTFELETEGGSVEAINLIEGVIHVENKDWALSWDSLDGLEYPDYILKACDEYYNSNMYDINETPND